MDNEDFFCLFLEHMRLVHVSRVEWSNLSKGQRM